jgi:hypothetical protein
MTDLAPMTARRRGRRTPTLLAIGVNVAAYLTYVVVVRHAGYFDFRAHRALQYKIASVAWPTVCLLTLSGSAMHNFRAAKMARRQGRRSRAVGLATTGRVFLYISAAAVLAPVAVISALLLYVSSLPINGL